MTTDESTCPHCGDVERLEIFEVFDWRDFMLDGCCEAAISEAIQLLQHPRQGAQLMKDLDIEALAGDALRRVCDVGGGLQLDWQLRIVPVTQARAKQFVARHHSHCGPPAGWRFGAGIKNGSTLIGVVMAGRPVAPNSDQKTTIEINRLCVRRDTPAEFRWNAASMLLGWAAREGRKRGFLRAVTFTLASEPGTTLRAAGWTLEGMTRGGRWSRPSRARADRGPLGPKNRWTLELRKASSKKPPVLVSGKRLAVPNHP